MDFRRLGPLRRLDVLLAASVLGTAALAQGTAPNQDKKPADPPTTTQAPAKPGGDTSAQNGGQDAGQNGRQGRRRRGGRGRGANQNGAPAGQNGANGSGGSSGAGLRVVPMGQTGGTAGPGGAAGTATRAQAPGGQQPGAAPPAGQAPVGQQPGAPGTPPAGGPGGPGGFGGGRGFGRGSFGGNRPAPGGTVSMDFRGSDVNNVLKFFAMATGWQIVPDPALTGPVTIISPEPLTIDQAFQVLQSTLEVRGFTGQLDKRGDTTILKIVPLATAVQSTPIVQGDQALVSPEALKGQVITQVISVDNADATALARELAPLVNKGASIVASTGTNSLIVTDTASNVRRIAELVQMLDKSASNTDFQMFHLQHADASEVSDALNDLFGKIYGRGNPGQPTPQPGQPQPPPQPVQPGRRGQPGGAAGASQMRGAVVATADTRTNSVLVFASEDNMKRVTEIIRQLDDPAATALKTKIVKMQYADALEVSDTINTILSNSVGATSNNNQAASFRQRVFGGGGRFGGFGGFGGGQQDNAGQVQSTDPFAKVVGDARTNSLIITATDERMAKIDDLITQLDVPVPVEPTTFVVPVRNAQAQDMAYLLGQAFGTGGSQPSNPFGNNIYIGGGNNNRNSGFGNRQPINRRQGQSSGSSPFGRATGRAMPNMASPLADGAPGTVHGAMVPGQGFVPDGDDPETRAAAGAGQFFFGGRGGFGQQQQPTPQYGRGANGQYSNFLQLRNNVGVVADPATNSLIITTTPDNMPALRQIIDQLDVVPRQVMIEVIIAEASLDAANKLGVQFEGTGIGKIFGSIVNEAGSSNFPLGTAGNTQSNISAPVQPGAQYGISTPDGRFKALIQALATDNKVRILSTPKIFTSNNMQAEIDITTQIPYITNSFNGGLGLGQSINYSFLPVGITLNVSPRIARDGLVTIDVTAEASDLLGFDTLTSSVDPTTGRATTQTAPRTSDRYADTEVSVRDGEIVVIGGLMRDSVTTNVNKVPLLGDIPIIGNLFRSTSTDRQKTELMVFLIPHVVDGDAKNRQVVGQESAQMRKVFPDLEKQQPAFKNIPTPLPNGAGAPAPAGQQPAAQPNGQPPAPGQPNLNPGDQQRPAGRP